MSEFPGLGEGRTENDVITYRGKLGHIAAGATRSTQYAYVEMELSGNIPDVREKLQHVLDSLMVGE